MKHIEIISSLVEVPRIGEEKGICRITGQESRGMLFAKWVKKTFNEYAHLYPGTIISNEAAFVFLEGSDIVMKQAGRDKPQNFRTYSHIITKDGEWLCLTKSDKERIVGILQESPQVVSLNDTGKKHVYFKHRMGFWQLDDLHVPTDVEKFNLVHGKFMELLGQGYNQTELKTGDYKFKTIEKIGLEQHNENERFLSKHRGSPMFDFAAWLMYSS